VALYLSRRDLGNLAQVSKRTRDLAKESMRTLDFNLSNSIDQINAALKRYADKQLQELSICGSLVNGSWLPSRWRNYGGIC